MKFQLIDRITAVVPNKSIEAVRAVSLAEEYLADHFPMNPVMPGVMMLETLVQAAAWLIRISTNFEKSMVILKEARNVKYGRFVQPGDTLAVLVEAIKATDDGTLFKSTANVNGETAVTARFVMEGFNLADRDPSLAASDEIMRRSLRATLLTIAPGKLIAEAGCTIT